MRSPVLASSLAVSFCICLPALAAPSATSGYGAATLDRLLETGRFGQITRLIRGARTAADRDAVLSWLKRSARTSSGAYVNAMLAITLSRSPAMGDRADAAQAMVTSMAEIVADFPHCRDRLAAGRRFAETTAALKPFYLSELQRPRPERMALVDHALEVEIETADARRTQDDAFVCGQDGREGGSATSARPDLVEDGPWRAGQASVRDQLKGFLTSMMDPPVGADGRKAGGASITIRIPYP